MTTCSRCGTDFACGATNDAGTPCWCMALPSVVAVPGVDASCWCPACLREQVATQQGQSHPAASAASAGS